jgi:NinB protein
VRATVGNPQKLPAALEKARQEAKAQLMAGKRVVVSVAEETRREAQSRKFHALCRDAAKSGLKFDGKERGESEWKVIFISGHSVATGGKAELIRGIEGELINIRESSALMSVSRGASLIEYTLAFCAMHRVPTLEDES